MDSLELLCCTSTLIFPGLIIFIIFIVILYQFNKRLHKIEETVRTLGITISDKSDSIPQATLEADDKPQLEEAPVQYEDIIRETLEEQKIEEDDFLKGELSKKEAVHKEFSFKECEAFLAGKLFNILGSIILVIGIGFFLKYAFDNHWINETLRVIMGGAFGIGLLIGGRYFYKKDYAIVAQGLIGTGISVLYLSIYAAYNFYHLMPGTVAFILMIVTTIIAFQQALRYDAPVISFLGLIGGFLTPFLLATDTGKLNELFIYITLLDIGIFVILYKKDNWRLLELFSIIATFITFFAVNDYFGYHYHQSKTIFLVVFWLIYSTLSFSRPLRSIYSEGFLDYCTPIASALLFYIAVYSIYAYNNLNIATIVLLLTALVYIGFNRYLRTTNIPADLFYKTTVIIAITYIVLATNLIYQDYSVVILWTIEALAILWIGIYLKKDFIWKVALIIYAIALIKLFSIYDTWWYSDLKSYTFIYNMRTCAYLVFVAAIYFSSVLIKKSEISSKHIIQSIFQYVGGILLFTMITMEINDYFSKEMSFAKDYTIKNALAYNKLLTINLMCGLYSLPLFWLGLKRKMFPFVILGFVCLFIGLLFNLFVTAFYTPIESFDLFFNARFTVSIMFIIAIIVIHNLLRDAEVDNPYYSTIVNIIKIIICLIIFMLITGEATTYFAKEMIATVSASNDILSNLQSQKEFTLSIAWTIYAILLMGWGILKHSKVIRIMSIILFIITIMKVFIIDLSFMDSLLRIISFVALGVVLIFASFLYQKYKHIILENDNP